MKALVISAGLAIGLLGFTETASAQVIVSPGYGWGGGFYGRPVYPAWGWGARPVYGYAPRTVVSFGYAQPAWGWGAQPWGWGGGWGAPGWGWGAPRGGWGWGGRPGVSFGLTFIR
jgi:hypothetical protein